MSVKYIDTFSYRSFHDQFNSSFLATCYYAFGKLDYIVGKSSYKSTSKIISAYPEIEYKQKTIFVWGGDSRVNLLLRTFISALFNIFYLLFSKNEDILIYNSNNFLSVYFLNKINHLIKRKVLIVCHSEMSFLVLDCMQNNPIYKFRTKILRYIFGRTKCKLAKNLKFVVLGDSILANMSSVVPKEKLNHIISIDHPYIFKTSCNSTTLKVDDNTDKDKLRIGVVGTMAQEKGADLLVDIAQRLDLKKSSNISLEIIGKILCDTSKFINAGISIPDGRLGVPLEREVFDAKIDQLDYILYLYPSNSYRFTASGSFFDAINMKKPLISFKNKYFEYMFDKLGNIGVLVDDVDEVVETIEFLASNDKHITSSKKNSSYIRNMDNYIKNLSPLSVGNYIKSVQMWNN